VWQIWWRSSQPLQAAAAQVGRQEVKQGCAVAVNCLLGLPSLEWSVMHMGYVLIAGAL
jgi:hypothetical protein